jgi:hypothetical protein
MSLSVGIVGLPNVGKSTLFNALLQKQQALAANYPFATIEPNIGIVPVPDNRLPVLAKIANTTKIVPAVVEFVDIAGLVAGAAEGEGLGNKFLAHIRETNVIAHVVRVFEDSNVVKEGSIDPRSDFQTIETELMLADLGTLQKQVGPRQGQGKALLDRWEIITRWKELLNQGKPLIDFIRTEEEKAVAQELALLSAKPRIIVANVSESQLADLGQIRQQYSELLSVPADDIVFISAKLEAELAELAEADKQEYLDSLGIKQSGLELLIQKAYSTLGLQSFYTAGEKEARAWTVERGASAPEAAGVIHTDFIKHFIKAMVVSYEDFVSVGGWKNAREKGVLRQEGKDYAMRADDVVEFMIGK